MLNQLDMPNELLEAYMLLGKLYAKTKRNKKALAYQTLATDLRKSLMQEKDSETAEAIAGLEQQAELAQQGKSDALSQLMKQRESMLRKEAEIARLEMEAAELAQQRAELEKEKAFSDMEAAQTALQLNEANARQNVLIGLGLLALLIILAVWQRYTYIQQRKQARFEQERAEQLAQIDRLKDQFLANTSHELRTPLNGIIGLAEALNDRAEELSLAERKDNLGMIISSGKRLSSLVDDILDFSKMRNSELELKQKAIDIKSLVEVVLKVNQNYARGKDLVLNNDLPNNFAAVYADENRLQQILHNLVGNAIKFTEKGTVKVSAELKDKMAIICVADTGSGISPEKQAQIFEEFQQGDGATDRSFNGTGLGLAISKSLVELHGGKIWLESELAKGSKFYFSLPTSQEEAQSKAVVEKVVSRPNQILNQASNGKKRKWNRHSGEFY